MQKELELWQFIAERLRRECVMLLVVAESSGSSPGRQGYKMAVGADGELAGSIGGGVMEVRLVEESRRLVRDAGTRGRGDAELSLQEHRENSPNASGMICSGKQTVIFKLLSPSDAGTADQVIDALESRRGDVVSITHAEIRVGPPEGGTQNFTFEKSSDTEFHYTERLGFK